MLDAKIQTSHRTAREVRSLRLSLARLRAKARRHTSQRGTAKRESGEK